MEATTHFQTEKFVNNLTLWSIFTVHNILLIKENTHTALALLHIGEHILSLWKGISIAVTYCCLVSGSLTQTHISPPVLVLFFKKLCLYFEYSSKLYPLKSSFFLVLWWQLNKFGSDTLIFRFSVKLLDRSHNKFHPLQNL
jgi:hypothetical protein